MALIAAPRRCGAYSHRRKPGGRERGGLTFERVAPSNQRAAGGANQQPSERVLSNASFALDDVRLFTNGDFGTPDATRSTGWIPATDATFDTGVLVLGKASCACVWIKDDD